MSGEGWVTGGGECRAQVLLSGSGFKHAHPTQACACLSNLHLLENSSAAIPRPDSLWGCPPLDTGDLGTESHKLRVGLRWRQTEAPPHPFLIFPGPMVPLYHQFSA